MTLLLPNTHQQKCPSGLKVQLLYWDGKQYSKVFPKGARIGFAVARDGLNIANVNAANGGVSSRIRPSRMEMLMASITLPHL